MRACVRTKVCDLSCGLTVLSVPWLSAFPCSSLRSGQNQVERHVLISGAIWSVCAPCNLDLVGICRFRGGTSDSTLIVFRLLISSSPVPCPSHCLRTHPSASVAVPGDGPGDVGSVFFVYLLPRIRAGGGWLEPDPTSWKVRFMAVLNLEYRW